MCKMKTIEDRESIQYGPVYIKHGRLEVMHLLLVCVQISFLFSIEPGPTELDEGLFGVFLVPSHSDHHDLHISGLLESSLSVLHFH